MARSATIYTGIRCGPVHSTWCRDKMHKGAWEHELDILTMRYGYFMYLEGRKTSRIESWQWCTLGIIPI